MSQPVGYIEAQRKINYMHVNGKIEHEREEANYRAKWLVEWVREKGLPFDSVLDAGCRTGYAMDAFAAAAPAAEVAGVDIVPEFIARAELRGDAVVGDIQALPFDDEQFDWVFSCTAIEHAYDLPKAISEMQRVARVGFYCLTDLEDKSRFDQNPSHFSYNATPMEWLKLMDHPDWWPIHIAVPRKERIEMIYVRRDSTENLLEPRLWD